METRNFTKATSKSQESAMATSPSVLHIAMFPWFAMGHITPYLQLANEFAKRDHKVSFFLPGKRTEEKLKHLNLHPDLIHFIPLKMPQVDGLSPNVEITADADSQSAHLISVAFDSAQSQLKISLQELKPDAVFYDFSPWLPALARPLGIKSIYLTTSGAVSHAFLLVPPRKRQSGKHYTVMDILEPPPGFPSYSCMKQRPFEARDELWFSSEFHGRMSFYDRLTTGLRESDAACFRACHELEGPFCDYVGNQYQKQVLLMGPVMPPPENSGAALEEKWAKWLGGFAKGSVVYCAFGSECVMDKDQLQELVLGLELTGLPFLARLKPPTGLKNVEEALPEGFEERVRGRGVVHGGWVQQQLILSHPSVGYFVSHCGFGSMWESLVNAPQIVVIPQHGDQFVNAKFLARELKVALEVERREEDGWYTKEDVCKTMKLAMDRASGAGEQAKVNHEKWKDFLLTEGRQDSYVENFITKLHEIIRVKRD